MGLLHLKNCQEESPLLSFLPEEAALDMLCVFAVLRLCPAFLPRWELTRQEGLSATEVVTSTDMAARRDGEKQQSTVFHRGIDKLRNRPSQSPTGGQKLSQDLEQHL